MRCRSVRKRGWWAASLPTRKPSVLLGLIESPSVHAGGIGSTSYAWRLADVLRTSGPWLRSARVPRPRINRESSDSFPMKCKKSHGFETGHQSVEFLVISREQAGDESTIGSRPSGTDLSCVGGRAVKRPRCADSCQVQKVLGASQTAQQAMKVSSDLNCH